MAAPGRSDVFEHLSKAVRRGKQDSALGSIEHYAAAAAAATQAGAAADSLCILFPLLSSAWSSTVATCVSGISATASNTQWQSAHSLLLDALPHLCARLSAGTLAPGQGSAEEKALLTFINGRGMAAYGPAVAPDSSMSAAEVDALLTKSSLQVAAQASGELVGYATALKAAGLALMRLYPKLYPKQPPPPALTPAERRDMHALVLGALALVQPAYQFRIQRLVMTKGYSALVEEHAIAGLMSTLAQQPSILKSGDGGFDARLGAAWAAVSPLLTDPKMERIDTEIRTRSHRMQSASSAAAIASHGGLRPCAGCGEMEVPGLLHKTCPCRRAAYCAGNASECQARHWPAHKAECKRVRAELAAAAA